MSLNVLNFNVGLLGHVDSGKTSLAKCLSDTTSTACFDKNPQSKLRGITIDLGFSSFSLQATSEFREMGYDKLQFTLVDCPGHASLIRTIIGGVQIIDIVILVIDVTKGIQTQTAECLVISEITKKGLIIALNKIDQIEIKKREDVVNKVTKKLGSALSETMFKDTPVIPVISKENYLDNRGTNNLIEKLTEMISIPERKINFPLVLAVDHCFLIKGKGTILTGTVLQGAVKLNDAIEIPVLKEVKKVKSIQIFRHDEVSAGQGDRIGICVTQFDSSQFERGLVCTPNYLQPLYGAVIKFNKVRYFKSDIFSNMKYHISVSYETVIGKTTLFSSGNELVFDLENEYSYLENYEKASNNTVYALIIFEKPIYAPPNSLIIGSKFDINTNTHSCRLAFFGDIIFSINDRNYSNTILPKLKLYVTKQKQGLVQKCIDENELIGYKLCKNHSALQKFINFKVELSTGEWGYIVGTFGQKNKIRIKVPDGLKPDTIKQLTIHKKEQKQALNEDITKKNDPIKITLCFKKYMYDKEKAVSQHSMF